MNAGKIIAGIIVALAATIFFSIFIVKEVNQAIVLQFGDPKRIILKPGLNFKLPFIQNVVFLDKRILNIPFCNGSSHINNESKSFLISLNLNTIKCSSFHSKLPQPISIVFN